MGTQSRACTRVQRVQPSVSGARRLVGPLPSAPAPAAEYGLLLATFGAIMQWGLEGGIAAGFVLSSLYFAYAYAQSQVARGGGGLPLLTRGRGRVCLWGGGGGGGGGWGVQCR